MSDRGPRCTKNNCRHFKDEHPDPDTCGGSTKCTTEICECELHSP